MSLITPVLRRLHSPDVDLRTFRPAAGDAFSVLVQAMFGPSDGPGEESFDILVCTPAWLAQELTQHAVVGGRHRLIVQSFDPDAISSYLTAYARSCQDTTWDQVATRLSRIGLWEIEDYRCD